MYAKFFSNKKGGSAKSIDYLLNDRVEKGTAKVLAGDENLTRAIIDTITNKQKVTVGVLSFEEKNLEEKQKEILMMEFEKTLFPGLSSDQYNILWVEHTDKCRLELNFVIPKVELSTGKALNPYFHQYDFSRIEMFEDICNIKYNLSSKKDPSKASNILGSKKKLNLSHSYQELDKQLQELVRDGKIESRDEIISLLKKNNIEITRESENGLSIKLPNSKRAKRFKGGIYDKAFTSSIELLALQLDKDKRAEEFNNRDKARELEFTTKRLEQYNQTKAEINQKKYPYEYDNEYSIQADDYKNDNIPCSMDDTEAKKVNQNRQAKRKRNK